MRYFPCIRKSFLLLCVGVCLGLTGCSYEHDTGEGGYSPGFDILANRLTKKEATPEWKKLVAEGKPQITVVLASRKAMANLVLVNTLGDVKTWLTSEDVSISTRHGAIVATRGLTPDLMAANVSDSLALLRAGKSGHADKLMSYLDGEGRTFTRSYTCDVTNNGDDKVTIGAKSIPVWSMQEVCYGLDDSFTNLYWVARSNGEIIQARQRIDPELGDISFRIVL